MKPVRSSVGILIYVALVAGVFALVASPGAVAETRQEHVHRMSHDVIPFIFETRDLRLLTAIHRWFGAQLSEHGSDVRAE